MGRTELEVDYDSSLYPKHVPTLREQARGKKWDLEEKIETREDVEHFTATGHVRNPFTWRPWLEDEYDADNRRGRMAEHSTGEGAETVTEAGIAERGERDRVAVAPEAE